MKVKILIIIYTFIATPIISKNVFGMTEDSGKAWHFVTLVSAHGQMCGKPPLKQHWYKFGKFRSACHRIKTKELNDLAKDFEYVEISKKNIFILNYNKYFDSYNLYHAFFHPGGRAKIWRTYGGYKEIQYFCERNDAKVCKSFKLNKVRFHK